MILKENDFIVFFGDSITDCGRNKQYGEGHYVDNPHGNGYVGLIFSYLRTKYPNLHIRVANKGISGNRTWDLLERIKEDVLDLHPSYMSLMIGVNDAWRMFDFPDMPDYQMTDEEYQNNIEKIVLDCQKQNIKVIMMSPFMMEINKSEPMMKKILCYASICKRIACKYNLIYIDIQEAFDILLKNITTHEISRDKIHPNMTGHMLIARTFINSIEKD